MSSDQQGKEFTSTMRPHHGVAIIAAANTYKKVTQVILEAIQNALDAEAKNVWININWIKRTISVRDDGHGVTHETFDKALDNVGKSIKPKGRLGRWGYGLVAPLGKCVEFTFTSQPKSTGNQQPYLRWTFVTDDIENTSEEIDIPGIAVEELRFSRSLKPRTGFVNWRTCVELRGIVTDKRIASVDVNELIETAVDEFRVRMLQRDVTLHLNVIPEQGHPYSSSHKAEPYSGEKLDPVQTKAGSNGVVRINLWLAKRTSGKYAGKVGVGQIDDAFRVPMDKFVRSVHGLLDKETAKALASGVFEGEITSNMIRLEATRVSFEENDGLIEFLGEIEKWYEVIGRAYYEEACDKADSERFRKNAEQTLDSVQKMLDDPGLKELRDLVSTFPPNPHGIGVPSPDGSNTGDDAEVSARKDKVKAKKKRGGGNGGNGGGDGGGNGGSGGGSGGGRSTDTDETVFIPDPNGKHRMTVKVRNFGLRFGETEDIHGPWQLDTSEGILWFNTSHPLYSQCSDARNADKVIQKYQRQVAIQALSLKVLPEDWQESAAEGFDIALRAYVSMITQ